MFTTNQRLCGVVSTHKERIISTSRERAVFRDILTEKHRPGETHRKCCSDRIDGVGSKTFLVDRSSNVTNFGCENSGECKKTPVTIQECALDETRS